MTVKLGDIAHREIGITTQVASYYIDGLGGYPRLGEGLTSLQREASCHNWTMSRDDADWFVRKVREYRQHTLGL